MDCIDEWWLGVALVDVYDWTFAIEQSFGYLLLSYISLRVIDCCIPIQVFLEMRSRKGSGET